MLKSGFCLRMIIVGQDVLEVAGRRHRSRGLDKALAVWSKVTHEARWRHFADVRQSWPSADYVEGYVVFNVRGSQFRLLARIHHQIGVVSVNAVMTHAEYDRWSANLR